ncbi:hypothetical protein [Gorillibacterium sp. sgz5001074]|uniref:hypothetical protein n=1 Tax=Gorillibacterium sp. sgz5001074 TaxID=3446695 RepID=UPI003F67FF0C
MNRPTRSERDVVTAFKALSDTVVPAAYGEPGAVDYGVEHFIMWQLDHMVTVPSDLGQIPVQLSRATASLLDAAAATWCISVQHPGSPPAPVCPVPGLFASLNTRDRAGALSLLQGPRLELGSLPSPYTYNAGFVRTMFHVLTTLPMMGFYSEWIGYGTTRLLSPDYRVMERFPEGWRQAGYPGPSYGYRELRGYLLRINRGSDVEHGL